jgi:hypothetical protein
VYLVIWFGRMIKIINKTDHVIALMIDGSWQSIMPYGLCCKFKTSKQLPVIRDGIRFNPLSYDGVIELPDKQNDTIIIVERDIALYIWKTTYRDDVCYLDHPIVRDDKYMSLAAMSLVCISEGNISYCL